MLLGYNTNGFAFHRLHDAVRILHEIGYRAVGITLDVHHLDPFQPAALEQAAAVRRLLDELQMCCVVETGARFLLDARRKHQPTLVDPNPEAASGRLAFLMLATDVAAELGADALSFWSGSPPDGIDPAAAIGRLTPHLQSLLDHARKKGVRLALEPEPGMAVAAVEQGLQVVDLVGDPLFGLTVDVGHIHCNAEGDVPTILRRVSDRLFNIHIEDMRAGVHDHLMFGEGEMNFPPIFDALRDVGYQNGVYVELSRHAHDAVNAARQAMAFLKPLATI